jgi:hypothetical protein
MVSDAFVLDTFTALLVAQTIFNSWLLFDPAEWAIRWLELVSLPLLFRMFLVVLALLNATVNLLAEQLVLSLCRSPTPRNPVKRINDVESSRVQSR